MALSSQNRYCSIRKQAMRRTPEEEVRQMLIDHMVQNLGYPAPLLAIEKKISQLPHLALYQEKLPNRRVDILAYAVDEKKRLHPLLLIECKAKTFSQKEERQLFGYNYYIGARYVALVASQKTLFFTQTDGKTSARSIPAYKTLLEMSLYK